MADVDQLSIRISATTRGAVNQVNRLAEALRNLQTALNGIDGSSVDRIAGLSSSMSSAAKSAKAISAPIQKAANGIAEMGSKAGNIVDFKEAAEGLGESISEIAPATEKASGAQREFGKVSAEASSKASTSIRALKAGWGGFTSTLKKIGSFFGNVGKKALSASKHIGKFSRSSNKAKISASGLVKELTRIGKMFKLMLTRMVLRQVISGIGDGFKNLAQYSKQFDSVISLLWNDFRQLGNSIAAAASPLLSVLAPALHAIIQLVIQAVNAINQLLSALTGLTSFVRAKKLTDSYAKSLDKAGSKAKELKKTVLGFDELNQLQDNKSSGGGGTSPLDMFEDAPISDKWKEWAKKIKDMWKKGDFTELGRAIGEWLLKALESIPWNKIKAKAYKLGKSLATLINGFVEVPKLGYTIGKSLAEAINTAIMFVNGYVHNLHWDSIGRFIADTFNGFFENIDWRMIKDTVVTGFKGLATSINTFLARFNWDNISNTIINSLDVIVSGVKTFFETVKWGELGAKIGEQIKKSIQGINWREVGEALGDILQAAIDFCANLVSQIDVDDVVKALSDMLAGFFDRVDVRQAGETLGELLQKLIDIIKGFWEENHDDILQAVADFFGGIFSKVDKDDLRKIIETILSLALLNGIASLSIYVAKEALKAKITTMIAGAATEAGTAAEVTAAAEGAGSAAGLSFLGGLAAAVGGGILAATIIEAFDLKEGWAEFGAFLAEEFRGSPLTSEETQQLENFKQAYDGFSGTLNLFKDGLKEVGRLLGFDIPQSTYTLRDEMGNVTRVVNEYGKSVIEFTDDLNISVEKSTDFIGICDSKAAEAFRNMKQSAADVTFEPLVNETYRLDGSTTHAFDNMGKNSETFSRTINHNTREGFNAVSLNSKVVTENIPTEMANAQISITGTVKTLNQNVSKETKDAFTNAENESKKFTVDMPESVTSAQESMSITVENLAGDFDTNMSDIQKTVADSTEDINNSLDTVKDGMTEDKWTFEGVWKGLTNTFERAKDGIKGIWNGIVDSLNGSHSIFGETITIDLPKLYATGGFPRTGEMFIARESGAEMVGSINGRTAVANNDQITNAIAQAVYAAITSANSQNSGGNVPVNTTIMLDGMVLARAVSEGQRNLDRRYSPTTA